MNTLGECRDLAALSEGLLARVDTAVELQQRANRVLVRILGGALHPRCVLHHLLPTP